MSPKPRSARLTHVLDEGITPGDLAGDPAAAIGVFHDWRHQLADELGLDPSREALELCQRILGRELPRREIRPEGQPPSSGIPAAAGVINDPPGLAVRILTSIPGAVYALGHDGHVVYVNHRGAGLAGLPAGRLIGRTA